MLAKSRLKKFQPAVYFHNSCSDPWISQPHFPILRFCGGPQNVQQNLLQCIRTAWRTMLQLTNCIPDLHTCWCHSSHIVKVLHTTWVDPLWYLDSGTCHTWGRHVWDVSGQVQALTSSKCWSKSKMFIPRPCDEAGMVVDFSLSPAFAPNLKTLSKPSVESELKVQLNWKCITCKWSLTD